MGLVIEVPSRPWRRRLGWLGWAVLEEVALSAHPDGDGWSAAVGVRAVAQNLGMTKDTAARALSVLVEAGLVERGRVRAIDGRIRSGYRIRLPEGAAFVAVEDVAGRNAEGSGLSVSAAFPGPCQSQLEDLVTNSDNRPRQRPEPLLPGRRRNRPSPLPDEGQGRLFDLDALLQPVH